VAHSALKQLLYVDDDPDIRAIVRIALGHVASIRMAESGERALQLVNESKPDLVLMDVMMPGLDGPSTMKRIREQSRFAALPVIFVTAKAMPAEVARFLKMGADGVIAKPFDPIQLGANVRSLWSDIVAARAQSGG
jgi:two-component system OmpR family response regulator